MTRTIDSKLPDVGTTIFTVMSQLAQSANAINLAQGFPSFDPPAELRERIAYHLNNGANQYAPLMGAAALREAIAEKTARLQSRCVNPDSEITISSGATEGLFSAIQATVRPGDEVIIFDPAFDCYEPAVLLAGGISRRIPLQIDKNGFDFSIDWQALEDCLNAKTRLIILNFPHNPSGAVLQADDLNQLARLIRHHNCLLVSDEVYEHIVFDEQPHCSLLSHDELWERSIVISSFGKTFHATGWKVGYCIAPNYLTEELRKVHQYVVFSVSTPVQHGIADFMRANPEYYAQLPAFYEHKRDLFCDALQGSRFKFQPSKSTFFQTLDYSTISTQADLQIAKEWTQSLRIASIPYSVFCAEPFTGQRLRFCFAKDDETLLAAAKILHEL